ncbi:hypothetical protein SAMN02745163_01145 [Clostridium cavendishii DSM 21758]|uniref:Uncharacterized protein n=1 Tax=Clostridium cavendishii DSM 21758 TaxID=1121302 RepID=A0A1M6FIC9_9CLOT|nr:hypothetical protein [Clostridium cavendishii]SHI97423.1 hypothetical protein SAMN02745163_01145 [Clostridium cavendishii DSM 21758]
MKHNVGVNLDKELKFIMKNIKMPKPRNNKDYMQHNYSHSKFHENHESSNLKQMSEAIKDFIKGEDKKACCCKSKSQKKKIAIYSGITAALALSAVGITALSVHNKNKKSYKYKLNNYLGKASKLTKTLK